MKRKAACQPYATEQQCEADAITGAATEIDLQNIFFRVGEVAEEFGFGKVAWDRLKSGTGMPYRADRNGESGKVAHAAEGSTGIRLG